MSRRFLGTIFAALCGLLATSAHAWQWMDEDVETNFALGSVVTVDDPARFSFRVAFGCERSDVPTRYYLLELKGPTVSLARVEGNRSTPLGLPGKLPELTKGQKLDLTVHRDAWRVAVICNRRVVFRAYDAVLRGPAVGYEPAVGGKVEDIWLQPYEEIYAADTFEREEGAKDEWETLSGNWQLISLREDRQAGQMKAELSANAFSYFGKSDTSALTATGRWFWRNAEYAVSVRARDDTPAVGLAFYVQDKDNYLLLRWENRYADLPAEPALRLLAVVDGTPTVLAETPGGFFPYQWYRLQARVCDGEVTCLVDGERKLSTSTDLLGQGRVGMYVEGKDGAWFDDMRVVDYEQLWEPFDREVPGKWQAAGGAWQIADGVARARTADRSLLLTGPATWKSYAFSAQVADGPGGRGLIVGATSDNPGYLFRWAPAGAKVPYAGKAQIVQLGNPEQIIAEKPLPGNLPARILATVVLEPDYIAGILGNTRVVDCVLQGPLAGGVGLYAEGAVDASFRLARMEHLPVRTMARVTKEYTNSEEHFEMAEWATTRSPWVKPADDANPKVWWTKGDYYGPLQVSFELKQLGQVEGAMKVVLEGERNDPTVGAQLTISATKGTKKLTFKLEAGGKELGAAEIEAAGDTCPVSLERRGEFIVVKADGKILIRVPWQPAT
jgi:hypothetical protein